jgi:hypothetical protein
MTITSEVPEAGSAQAVSPRGRFFANQTFHFETLRNAGYIVSNCADLGEVLETVKVIAAGDVQSWYSAWVATADRVLALAERTQDLLSRGGAYMRASTYERMAEFLIPPDDPKRPESFEKTGSWNNASESIIKPKGVARLASLNGRGLSNCQLRNSTLPGWLPGTTNA